MSQAIMTIVMVLVMAVSSIGGMTAEMQEPASFEGFAEIVRPAAPKPVEAAAIELPEEYASYRTVRVANVDELLAAIAPQTVILLEEGEYDLAEATGYGAYGGEHYYWENPYDGPSLIIRGVDGLVLLGTGAGKENVRISQPGTRRIPENASAGF